MTAPLWQHREEIARRLAKSRRWLVCFDFDGVLTPIVAEPDKAHLSTEQRHLLRLLASRPGVEVAIVSGRALDDVSGRVGLPEVICAGNHGLEIEGRDLSFAEPAAVSLRAEVQALALLLDESLRTVPGARLENKGLTLSIHFRQTAPERQEEVKRIVQRGVALHEGRLAIGEGLKVCEVRPYGDWHKGTAVNWIKSQLQAPDAAVVYVGDDRTDEDAFQALPGEITVKVGAGPTVARYVVAGTDDVRSLLEWLIGLPGRAS